MVVGRNEGREIDRATGVDLDHRRFDRMRYESQMDRKKKLSKGSVPSWAQDCKRIFRCWAFVTVDRQGR